MNARSEWIEVVAEGPPVSKDEAALVFMGHGSPGVLEGGFSVPSTDVLVLVSAWDDPGAGLGPAPEEAESMTLTGYLPPGEPSEVRRLAEELATLGWKCRTSEYTDQDWTHKWKKGIRPVRVSAPGGSVFVRPTWSRAAPRPGEILIEIDPGMAFGTGSHHTTRMCLKALVNLLACGEASTEDAAVLDVGTGSGVLAIAAMKLGAAKAVGLDIDAVALGVARENIRHNRVKVTISAKTVENTPGRFTIVVANILSGELKRLAGVLARKVEEGGFLLLSGILNHETGGLKEIYKGLGLKFHKAYRSGDWSALVFQKPANGQGAGR